MFDPSHLLKSAFVVAAAAALAVGCSPRADTQNSIGDPPYKAVAGVKLLMNSTVDPQADVLWDAVGYIMTLGEEDQEIVPETDAEWDAVRNAAVTLSESGNLLMMERRAMDAQDWMKFSRELIDTSEQAMLAADARDPDALFEAGGQIYIVCMSCHESYIESDEYAAPDGPVDLTSRVEDQQPTSGG